MLKIRLTRKGKKNKAFFRLVVAEHTSPIKGRFLEVLGFMNPHSKEKSFKADRIKYWIGKGAQCSDTAHNLLVGEGIVEGKKRAVKMRKQVEIADSAPASAEATADKEKADPEKKAESTEVKPAEGEEKPTESETKPVEEIVTETPKTEEKGEEVVPPEKKEQTEEKKLEDKKE